jgi:zinc transport system ATP-binding protein
MKELIKAENISVFRRNFAVLDNVSLSIYPDDFTTVVGPNGAGKTTLLKALMDIIKPDKGTVTKKPDIKIGYVPQRLQPDKSMPLTAGRFLTLRKKTYKKEENSVSAETGISEFLHKPLHVLSGGELQRVLLARALLGKPDLLILDEPAQNLDISGQLELYSLIDGIYQKRNMAVLMVSHDLHLVMSSTRQVICLYHHISCSGTPSVITRDPAFKKIFGKGLAELMSVYTHSPLQDHDCENHDHTHHRQKVEDQ